MEKTIPFAARFLAVLLLWCNTLSAQNSDISLLRKIHSNDTRNADRLMKGITETHYVVGFCVPAGELIYGIAGHDKTAVLNGLQTLAGIGINAVITYGIKHTADRNRPFVTYPDIQPYKYYTSNSMPSGHTSFAFAVATSVSLQYPKWYVILPAYAWAGSVGSSRLYLGVHYPSDVVAGALIGAGSAFIAYKGQQWLLGKKHKKAKKGIE